MTFLKATQCLLFVLLKNALGIIFWGKVSPRRRHFPTAIQEKTQKVTFLRFNNF